MVLYSSHSSCKLVFLCSPPQFCIIMLTVSSCYGSSRSARASGKVIIIRYFRLEKRKITFLSSIRLRFPLFTNLSLYIKNFHRIYIYIKKSYNYPSICYIDPLFIFQKYSWRDEDKRTKRQEGVFQKEYIG